MSRPGVERLAAGVLAALMLAWLWQASQLPYVVEGRPGPGFFPVWLAGLGLVLTLAVLGGTFWRRTPAGPGSDAESRGAAEEHGGMAAPPSAAAGPEPDPPAAAGTSPSWRAQAARPVGALLGLVAFLALVPVLGFVVTLAAFLVYLSLPVMRMPVPSALAVSLGTVAFVYVVFAVLLSVPFPTGLVGI